MANSATGDCGLSLQDTYDGKDATGSGDLVDLLWSQLQSQQSENPQPSSESTVEDSGLLPKNQFDEYDDSTLRHLVTNSPLNFTICQPSENCDELQPPQTETAQLTSEESIREESCLQTVGRMRCGASVPDGYSRPNQPASPMKPLGVDEGIPTEMSDGHISSDWQYTPCVAPDPIMEAEQEMNTFSGVVSPLSDLMWRTNILTPQAQCDDQTRTTLCVGQTMHKSVQSSNVDKEDDPCGSGLRLEQFDHACGSNVVTTLTQSIPAPRYLMTTTTSSNVPTEHSTQHDNLLQTEDFIKDIKGARYTQGGRYISGYADNYEELQAVVTRHAQITGSNWHMDKLISAWLSDEARVAFLEKFNSSMKPRLFWMTNKGVPSIPDDGVPFATGGSEKISCKPASKQRSKDVSFCKCDARIYVWSIWRFPSFSLRIAGNEKARRRHMELLHEFIAAGVVTPMERYYFSLPTAWAHTSHKVPEFPRPGKHFIPLHATLVDEIQRLLQTGNTFISEVKEHIAQFAEFNLTVELALNPEDESLQVSREKVNGHMYHMLKDGKITMPEPLSVLTEEQICCAHIPVHEPSGTLSPRVLQPVCSDIQDSSGGEEDLDPCGGDQEWEQLGDEERIALDGEREEVRCLLELLHSQAYACHNIRHVQRLRRTLTAASCHMSSILCNKPSPAQWRKRSTNTRDTSFPKKTSLGSPSPLACS